MTAAMSEQTSYGIRPGQQFLPPRPPAPQNGLGTAAMWLGIAGLALVITVALGVVCGLLAIVFGFIGRSRVKRGLATNRGHATAGIVTGIVAILASAVALYFYIPRGYDHTYCTRNSDGKPSCLQK